MRSLWLGAVLVGTSACSSVLGIGDLHLTDASNPPNDTAPADVPGDERSCYGSGLVVACTSAAPMAALSLSGNVDTNTDPRCQLVAQPQGPDVCMMLASQIDVGATVVTGARPLVLVSASSITVSGALDASSTSVTSPRTGAGANVGDCAGGTGGTFNQGGGGGGGGGLGSSGATGGRGDNSGGTVVGGSPGAPPTIVAVRGGCAGGKGGIGTSASAAGLGGAGGGALYLIGSTLITVSSTGAIYASGAGGGPGNPINVDNGGGGGGGGGGGLVGIEAPTITVDGTIAANGGGGGGGADAGTGHFGGDGTTQNYNVAAQGGQQEVGGHGGPVGNGAAAAIAPQNGQQAGTNGGGGGGGGGLGVVWVKGALTGTKISPAPSLH